MESIKYITTQPHEMDDSLLEKYIDYIGKKHACSPRDDPLRSRDFLIKEARIEPNKKDVSLRCYIMKNQEIIGSGFAGYVKRERDNNPDHLRASVFVLPKYRRKGLGTVLFEKIHEFASSHGRLILNGGLYPIDGEDGPKFLESRGIVPKINEKISRLYKDKIKWDFVNSRIKNLEEKLSRYTIVSHDAVGWANKILTDIDYALEHADFSTEVEGLLPLDDFEHELEVFTLEDVRRWAENTLKVAALWDSRTFYLLDGDKIIAMSGTYYPNDPPVKDVGTGLTGVRKAYQRQGIASFLKIKILKYYMDHHPNFEYIYTENAASNVGMLGINVSLGFKPTYEWQTYQGKLNEENII